MLNTPPVGARRILVLLWVCCGAPLPGIRHAAWLSQKSGRGFARHSENPGAPDNLFFYQTRRSRCLLLFIVCMCVVQENRYFWKYLQTPLQPLLATNQNSCPRSWDSTCLPRSVLNAGTAFKSSQVIVTHTSSSYLRWNNSINSQYATRLGRPSDTRVYIDCPLALFARLLVPFEVWRLFAESQAKKHDDEFRRTTDRRPGWRDHHPTLCILCSSRAVITLA